MFCFRESFKYKDNINVLPYITNLLTHRPLFDDNNSGSLKMSNEICQERNIDTQMLTIQRNSKIGLCSDYNYGWLNRMPKPISMQKNKHEYEKNTRESHIFLLCISIYVLNYFDFVPASSEDKCRKTRKYKPVRFVDIYTTRCYDPSSMWVIWWSRHMAE
jgi:hypothetical protein